MDVMGLGKQVLSACSYERQITHSVGKLCICMYTDLTQERPSIGL